MESREKKQERAEKDKLLNHVDFSAFFIRKNMFLSKNFNYTLKTLIFEKPITHTHPPSHRFIRFEILSRQLAIARRIYLF